MTGPSPLEFSGGFQVLSRSFNYTDDVFSSLRPYSLGAAPAVFAKGQWYPGAHVTDGPLAHIGIKGGISTAIGVSSSTSTGESFPTESWGWSVGLRGRLPVDDVTLHADVGYGGWDFTLSDAADGTQRPDLPNVSYQFVELGTGLRWNMGLGLSLNGNFAYLATTSTGEIGSQAWFPRSSSGGFDVGAGVGWKPIDEIEIRLSFDWRRFFFSMNPEPGDARVAGGAADDYIGGSVGVAVTPKF